MDPRAEPADFKSVHDRYRPLVQRYLGRLVGDSEAEDLTQRVLLKVSRALPEFRGESSLSTWIYRIASNTAMDSFRQKSREPPIETDAELAEAQSALVPDPASVEGAAIREQMSSCVREFIDQLPPNYRTVLVLSDLEGFTNEEIAGILQLTVGTVKIRLHRAREKLRGSLQAGCSFDHETAGGFGCDRKPAAPGAAPLPRRA